MYKISIKDNTQYLIPFIEGIKYYGSSDLEQGGGTMMILNDKGDILTCAHIANEFIINNNLAKSYSQFIQDIKLSKNKEQRKQIEKKYGIKKDMPVLTHIDLPLDIQGELTFDITFHEYLDLALIRFKDIKTERDNYPIFSEKFPEQGQSVCKLGYAFPEFDIFKYSNDLDNIVIKEDGIRNFPVFPMDGIVTRGIVDEHNILSMFETSTPGLRGQSGGPIFGPDGIVYGIQSMTVHLDLNFDVNKTVKRGIENKKVNFTPFINLGVGISSTEIINFLEKNNIEFQKK